jgi:UDP:flavonoid glycosyltransferase YjiC (YdhE family)
MKSKLAGKKILLACVPMDGHFNPLTGLAKYLQEIGCDVRWYVSSIYADKLKKLDIPHYPYVKALDINGHNIHQLLPELKTTASMLEKSMIYQKNLFAGRAAEYYKDILDIHASFPFELMIADNMYSAIPFVRHKIQIPVVAIGVIPLPEKSVDTAPYRTGLPPAENDSMRADYAYQYQEITKVFAAHTSVYTDILQQYDIPFKAELLPDMLLRSADLYLQIGTPDFEYKRSDLGSNIRFVGALMPYAMAGSRAPWFDVRLNQYKKIVLVTQGTIEADVSKLLEPTLRAFEHTDVLVIATTGGNGTEQLRARFTAKNLIIEDFIAFDHVMPYASVYVTNGGYSGVMLSISHQLPMVAAGQHELKNEICARIGYFKYGINLKTESPSSEAIREAASEIMDNPIYKTNVTRLCHQFEAYNAHELCAGHITELIQKHADLHRRNEFKSL